MTNAPCAKPKPVATNLSVTAFTITTSEMPVRQEWDGSELPLSELIQIDGSSDPDF
jgi:hypothetical protein